MAATHNAINGVKLRRKNESIVWICFWRRPTADQFKFTSFSHKFLLLFFFACDLRPFNYVGYLRQKKTVFCRYCRRRSAQFKMWTNRRKKTSINCFFFSKTNGTSYVSTYRFLVSQFKVKLLLNAVIELRAEAVCENGFPIHYISIRVLALFIFYVSSFSLRRRCKRIVATKKYNMKQHDFLTASQPIIIYVVGRASLVSRDQNEWTNERFK